MTIHLKMLSGFSVIKNQENDLGIELVKELIKYDCEAVITGGLDPTTFNMIADACITRFNGAGFTATHALEMMGKHALELIRNLEGTEGCNGLHHKH